MPLAAYHQFCQTRRQIGQWRGLRSVQAAQAGRICIDGKTCLNFSSNNYMGLAGHPVLIQRAKAWAETWGVGATASRLVCGNLEIFGLLEEKLCRGKGSETALLLNAGFQANSTLLSALLDPYVLGKEPLVFCDRLNHASLHHGIRAAGVRQIRYRHNDLNHLESLLQKYASSDRAKFIVSETVFSMDGDRCDVAELIALKERYGAFLYLDEAHATGVLGPKGWGLAAEFPGQVELVMGTFSKGLGGFGAYAACSHGLKNYLINHCAGLIYATALPPAVLGAMDAALDLFPSLDVERERLQRLSVSVRHAWQAANLNTGCSTTQIIPLLVGDDAAATAMSQNLEKRDILAVAIRPPTVPTGGSRLRFSLTALHSEADVRCLIETVVDLAGAVITVHSPPQGGVRKNL